MHNVLCKRPRLKTLALIFMGLIAFVATLGFSNVHTTHAASVWINSGAADLATSSKWKTASGTSITEDGWWRKRDGSANGTVLFCVQLGAPLNNNLNTGFAATTVTDAQHKHISEIAYYGYYAQSHTYTNEMFTQWAIWQYLGDTYVSSPLTSQYNAWKANVNAKVAAYDKAPSFNNTTVNIDAGTTKALNDTNGTLGTYASTATATPAGLKASISGNTLNITAANNAVVSGGAIKFADNIAATYEGAALLYSRPGFQSVILPKIDPTFKKFTVNVNVIHYGTVKLTKQDAETGTAQNGATFAGATFKLTDTKTGATETLTTDASGTAVSGKHAIGDGYSIVETKVPAGYKLNTTPVTGTFTHASGDTTYSAASVQTAVTIKDNYIYHARIKVNKQDSLTGTKPENGNTFAGAVFKLTDTTTGISETLTTDSNGIAVSSANFAVGDAYTLVETTAPKGYQLNSAVVSGTFTRTKEDGYANTNALTVKDEVIPDQISIHKTDETGKDLAGIKFKISDTRADLMAGKFLKLAADGKTVVFPNQAGYSDSLQDYVATTNAKGIATWSNIVKPASKTDRTYYFDEISTDKDHQLLTKGSAISAGDTGVNNTYAVVNQSKIKLPNTGSQDAGKLAVVLIIAMLGASTVGVSLVINKKKGNN